MWQEVLTEMQEQLYPVLQLRTDIPEKFQIRIVIWNVEDLPSDRSLNVQIKCTMNNEEGAVDKLTDTHWNAKEGQAEFNWRIIYKVHVLSSSHCPRSSPY